MSDLPDLLRDIGPLSIADREIVCRAADELERLEGLVAPADSTLVAMSYAEALVAEQAFHAAVVSGNLHEIYAGKVSVKGPNESPDSYT